MTAPEPTRAGARASLRARLLWSISVFAVTLVAVCALSTFALARLGGAIGLILQENYTSVVACQEMNEALERLDSAALLSAAGHDELARPLIAANRPAFEAALARETAVVTLPGEGELVEEVRRRYRDYVTRSDGVLGRPPQARMSGYLDELLPLSGGLRGKISAIRDMNQRAMQQADSAARLSASRTFELAIGVSALALCLGAWLAFRIPQMVLAPVDAYARRARAIGDGKLDVSVPLPDVQELVPLGEALDKMQERLRAYRESSLGELLAAKDLGRATVAAMVDPVLVFSHEGDVLLANEAAEAIFRISPHEPGALGRRSPLPDGIAVARDRVLSSSQAYLPDSLSDAMRWLTSEGERYFLVRALPVRRDESTGAAAVVLAQDVTRFRRIDALKSDVVATVSHELKTPLTSLRLATHMLLDEAGAGLDPIQRELAETAREQTERLQSTVNELLDLVRIEREAGALHVAAVDPATLLGEIAAAHRTVAEERGVELRVEAAPSPPVDMDPEQIAIVLGNLVSNAIRHSPANGAVSMTARCDDETLVIEVRDQGSGIAAEDRQRIFDRHVRLADPSTLAGRHGLGLAIASEIAERHGGSLSVDSELGAGSTFRLVLPRGPSRAAGQTPARALGVLAAGARPPWASSRLAAAGANALVRCPPPVGDVGRRHGGTNQRAWGSFPPAAKNPEPRNERLVPRL